MAVNKNQTLNSTKLMRRLVQLAEANMRKEKLEESGTSTTDLPPSTNATRQMQADVASTGREGVPAPSGGTPSEKSGAEIPALIDPNGEDRPANIGANYGKGGSTVGMQMPADIKPVLAGPGTDTTAPGSDTSAGVQAEIAKAKAKSGRGFQLESATSADILKFLIEHFGSADALVFSLVADGAPFGLAEALVASGTDLDGVDARIIARLTEMAKEAIALDSGDAFIESVLDVDPLAIIGALLDEMHGDTVRKAVERVTTAAKRDPSEGHARLKAARDKRVAGKRPVTEDIDTLDEKIEKGAGNGTYKVIRMYRDGHPTRVKKTGLTMAEAQQHCSDPETSSSTCTSAAGKRHTESHGPWFDGWTDAAAK